MAALAKPKLYYFDGPGLGEIARVLLVSKGIEFDDVRIGDNDWGTFKPKSPLGTVPYYEEGDVQIGCSLAIARYLAEKNELGGKNQVENAQLESYADAMAYIMPDVYMIKYGPEDQRAERKVKFINTTPGKLAAIESQIKSDKNFLSENRLSWADFMASVCACQMTEYGFGYLLKTVPKFNAVVANIDEMDSIKGWRLKTH